MANIRGSMQHYGGLAWGVVCLVEVVLLFQRLDGLLALVLSPLEVAYTQQRPHPGHCFGSQAKLGEGSIYGEILYVMEYVLISHYVHGVNQMSSERGCLLQEEEEQLSSLRDSASECQGTTRAQMVTLLLNFTAWGLVLAS